MRSKLFSSVIFLMIIFLLADAAECAKTVYIGGTMSLTGPYAENTAAVLAAFEDYTRYVNEAKRISPWEKNAFPSDISLEVLWRDDELKPAKALSIYEELKAKGMLVYRVSGSPIALALKDRLNADGMGATSIASGPFLLSPPQTIFTHYPIYTDSLAAAADWFKEHWKREVRAAYLTADNAMGKSLEIPEMEVYLKKLGYEFVRDPVCAACSHDPTDHSACVAEAKQDRPCLRHHDQSRRAGHHQGGGEVGYGA